MYIFSHICKCMYNLNLLKCNFWVKECASDTYFVGSWQIALHRDVPVYIPSVMYESAFSPQLLPNTICNNLSLLI